MSIFKFSIKNLIVFLAFLSIAAVGCDKHDHSESEVITTVQVKLTGTGISKTFTWNDADGDGGNAPVIESIELPANAANIACEITVLDRSVTPENNITTEIVAESNDHLFTYTVDKANLTVAYDDKDGNGKNFGLKTKWTTAAASTGTLNIKLFHEPSNKDNTSAPGGDEDFNIVFPVVVK